MTQIRAAIGANELARVPKVLFQPDMPANEAMHRLTRGNINRGTSDAGFLKNNMRRLAMRAAWHTSDQRIGGNQLTGAQTFEEQQSGLFGTGKSL